MQYRYSYICIILSLLYKVNIVKQKTVSKYVQKNIYTRPPTELAFVVLRINFNVFKILFKVEMQK
jgi:hypothetical protein